VADTCRTCKNGWEHLVYLTDSALELIGDKKGYIFDSPRDAITADNKPIKKPVARHALAHAVRNNCPKECCFDHDVCQNDECKKDKRTCEEKNRMGVAFFRPHDLRRTANTHMARLKVQLEYREAILNQARGTLDGTYNQQ
jgi:integrase